MLQWLASRSWRKYIDHNALLNWDHNCFVKNLFDHFDNVRNSSPRLKESNKSISKIWLLKVHSCKFCNNKYMIASTRITNTEIFTFIAVLVFNLLSRKVLFINEKRQKKLLKSRLLFKKIATFTGELLKNCN